MNLSLENCSFKENTSNLTSFSEPFTVSSFVSGSSIEISCDGPLRPPFIAYQQGGLTYQYGKLALISAISNIK